MKRIRISTLLFVLVFIFTSVSPVAAKGAPKDPDLNVVRVETFEIVQNLTAQEYIALNPKSAESVVLASGCKGYTLGRKGYSGGGIHIWTYSWTINWCYNGSTITSVTKYRTVWGNSTWSFKGDIYESQSGGVGSTSYTHYGQGDFCMIDVGVCVFHSYPWVNQTVRRDGTYSGSAGGN